MIAEQKPQEALSHIYAPSRTALPEARVARATPLRAMWLFLVSLATFASTVAVVAWFGRNRAGIVVGAIGLAIGTLIALWGAASAVRSWIDSSQPRGILALLASGLWFVGNAILFAMGAFYAFMATFGFSRGRQLRRFGRVLLPRVVSGSSWAYTKVSVNAPSIPNQVAVQWRENGRTEHASVAAFARLTLDLVALGAPPRLISASQADAIDEVRHTELCFSLARSIDGKKEDPGPFPGAKRAHTLPPTRTLALAALAVDSLVDGALHEGVSARIIAKLAKRCEVPAIRSMLKEIAADEGRHSAHGWDVVEWCFAEGGRPVANALLGAARALPARLRASTPPAARDGSWEAWGIHGDALEQAEYADARAAVVQRVETLVHPPARAA